MSVWRELKYIIGGEGRKSRKEKERNIENEIDREEDNGIL